jgi:formylglycine-generating enzyme required for sulfatase activity
VTRLARTIASRVALASLLGALASLPSLRAADAQSGTREDRSTRVVTLTAQGPLMVRISAGPVVIGSTADEVLAAAAQCTREPLSHRCSEQTFANELGRRTISLPSFWLDRTEVRVSDYARCVAVGACAPAAYADGAARFERADFPVTFVRFVDARNYCAFRDARLPTEAEFERAARGPHGRAYPWGELYNAHVCNHGRLALMPNDDNDGYAELAPVGSYPEGRTPEGILDLSGNVAEWQADAYRERYQDPPAEDGDGARRVVRGGSFVSGAAWLRGAARDSAAPDTQRPDLGFRCARSAEEP